MKRTVSETIQLYLNKGRSSLERKLIRLENKNLNTQSAVLPHNAAQSVRLFLEREKLVISRLSNCKGEDELAELVYKSFGDIPRITELTLSSYIYHIAFKHDIPLSASCEALIVPSAKKSMDIMGVSYQKLRKGLSESYSAVQKLTDIEVVDMLNRHQTIIREFPYKQNRDK